MHRVPAPAALLGVLGFVLVVVATPADQPLAFAGYAALLVVAVAVARLPVRTVLVRMLVEVPFVAYALLVPFVATGPQVEVLGVALARDGLVDAGAFLAKATLGVVAAVLLGATQHPRDLLLGLQRLRMPALVVTIAGFMFRYTEVVLAEMRRMRVARESRGFEGRSRAARPGAGAVDGRAVHPVVRARRAGAPGDAQPGLAGQHARDGRAARRRAPAVGVAARRRAAGRRPRAAGRDLGLTDGTPRRDRPARARGA